MSIFDQQKFAWFDLIHLPKMPVQYSSSQILIDSWANFHWNTWQTLITARLCDHPVSFTDNFSIAFSQANTRTSDHSQCLIVLGQPSNISLTNLFSFLFFTHQTLSLDNSDVFKWISMSSAGFIVFVWLQLLELDFGFKNEKVLLLCTVHTHDCNYQDTMHQNWILVKACISLLAHFSHQSSTSSWMETSKLIFRICEIIFLLSTCNSCDIKVFGEYQIHFNLSSDRLSSLRGRREVDVWWIT